MRGTRVKFADMETEYLLCRAIGHSWDEFNPIDKGDTKFGWRMSLRCTRCRTERHDIVGIHGDVVQRAYEYPEGYQLAGRSGGGRMPASKSEVRRELYQRRRAEKRQRSNSRSRSKRTLSAATARA